MSDNDPRVSHLRPRNDVPNGVPVRAGQGVSVERQHGGNLVYRLQMPGEPQGDTKSNLLAELETQKRARRGE